MGHQHGRHFIVLGHQYGRRDVMWNTLYLGYYSIYHEHLLEDSLFTTQEIQYHMQYVKSI